MLQLCANENQYYILFCKSYVLYLEVRISFISMELHVLTISISVICEILFVLIYTHPATYTVAQVLCIFFIKNKIQRHTTIEFLFFFQANFTILSQGGEEGLVARILGNIITREVSCYIVGC